MITWRNMLFLIAGILLTCALHAQDRLPLYVEYRAWNASHIAVATEGREIDGFLTIIESWHGDLKGNEVIHIPELASLASEDSRRIDEIGRGSGEDAPTHITCSRMVLFLKKATPTAHPPEEPNHQQKSERKEWLPVFSSAEMKFSIVWIENDGIYSFYKMAEGIRLMREPVLELSGEEMKSGVLRLLKARQAFLKATSLPKSAERAKALLQFMGSDFHYVEQAALQALGECGKEALPLLRTAVSQEGHTHRRGDLLEAFARAGGAQAGLELTDMLANEFRFWVDTGPKVKRGWLHGTKPQPEEAQVLHDRYSKTICILFALKHTGFRGYERVVADFREFWTSLPQLAEYTKMTAACDVILGQPSQDETEPKHSKREEKPDKEKQAPGFTPGEMQAAGFNPRASRKHHAGRRGESKPGDTHPARTSPRTSESTYLYIFLAGLAAFAILVIMTRKR